MNENLPNLKKEARRNLRKRRDAMAPAELKAASQAICSHALDWISAMKSRGQALSKVCAFLRTGTEPDLMHLIEQLTPQIVLALPRVTGEGRMEFRIWRPGDPTALNQFGILEPTKSAPLLVVDQATLLLIPALTVTNTGFRLGYGGGYYDRFLSEFPTCLKVAVVYSSLISEELPTEPHDVPVDFILTENGMNPSRL